MQRNSYARISRRDRARSRLDLEPAESGLLKLSKDDSQVTLHYESAHGDTISPIDVLVLRQHGVRENVHGLSGMS
jgi:hypothetical protein